MRRATTALRFVVRRRLEVEAEVLTGAPVPVNERTVLDRALCRLRAGDGDRDGWSTSSRCAKQERCSWAGWSGSTPRPTRACRWSPDRDRGREGASGSPATGTRTAPVLLGGVPGPRGDADRARGDRGGQRRGEVTIGEHETRRNLVTEGVPLNHLVGRTFRVGAVVFYGCPARRAVRLPRSADAKPGVARALAHRAGLRADIVTSGILHVGDDDRRSRSPGSSCQDDDRWIPTPAPSLSSSRGCAASFSACALVAARRHGAARARCELAALARPAPHGRRPRRRARHRRDHDA